MRIFHRHYLKELVANVVLAFGVLYFVTLMVVVAKLTYMTTGLDPWVILKTMVYWSVDPLPHLVPVATMIGVVLTYGRAGADNEILAIRMGGVHIYQVLLPAIFLGVMLSALNAWLLSEVIPSVYYKKHRMSADVASQFFSKINPVNNLITFPCLKMRWDHKDGDIFKKVWVDYKKEGRTGYLLTGYADSVRIEPPDDNDPRISIIFNNFRSFCRGEMTENKNWEAKIEFFKFAVDVGDLLFKNRRIRFSDMTTRQIMAGIESNRIWSPSLARHRIHGRMAHSMAALLFAIIGAAIGMMFRRGGRMAAFGISFFPIAAYYGLLFFSEALAVGGKPPVVTGWLPAWVLFLVGLVLVRKVARV